MLLRLQHFRHVAGNASPHGAAAQAKLTLVAASFCIILIHLDFFALNLALPRMASELRTSPTNLHWVLSAYLLSQAAFLIPGGRLGDILGRKRILMAGLVIFGLCSLGVALAPNAGTAIAFRTVQGIGSAIIFPLAVAIVTNAFPTHRVKRAIGYAYGIGAVSMALGPPFGGGMTELVVWRVVPLVNVPLCIITIAVVAAGVRESHDPTVPRSIDLPGLALVAAGIALVTLAVDLTSTWQPLATAGIAVVGLLILAAFVQRERLAKYPLVKLDLFRNRPYVIVTLLGMVANTAIVIGVFGSTLYLQQGEGRSPFAAGLILLTASVGVGVAGPIAGRLGEHLNIPVVMAISAAIGGIGLFVVSLGGGSGSYLPGLALFGLSYGVGYTMSNIGTQSVVARELVGEASGVTLAIVVGVAGLGVAAAATLIDIQSRSVGLTEAIEDTLRWTAAGSIVASGLLLLFARRRP
ncbi:MFS transporter [Salinispora fenicalii]|uniref:MFS transporter n=1 Tax=Salinispora fenicalii TaxID=1137263 RepID=UPI0004882459|nr:MFS transporter [Salinispora fenicalii]